jgi:hypothetical protein
MAQKFNVADCNMINLPSTRYANGSSMLIENTKEIPFDILRVYYLYDIPGGASRGGHAHKNLEQFIVAVSGSFDIFLDDGVSKKIVHMNIASYGLHLRPGIWREVSNFSSGAICLVFVSLKYDEDDYIRVFDEFKIAYGTD